MDFGEKKSPSKSSFNGEDVILLEEMVVEFYADPGNVKKKKKKKKKKFFLK